MRRSASVLILVLLALFLTPKRPVSPFDSSRRSPARQKIFDEGLLLFSKSEYEAARLIYETAFHDIPPGDAFDRTSALLGVGGCLLMTQQYPRALAVFAHADDLARQAGLTKLRIIVASNRASIYRRMGDVRSAQSAIEQVKMQLLTSRDPVYLTQAASLLRGADPERALPLFSAAIQAAIDKGDRATEALAWLHLGTSYLQQSELSNAEEALTQAFRLRASNGRTQMQSCYFQLGRLRRLQGRLPEALTLLLRANESSRQPGAHIPVPYIHFEIARVHLETGNFLLALPEFEAAVRSARELRLQILPAEIFRISAETSLQEIFSQYIRAGIGQYRKTGDVRMARRMFEVSEESRAALFEQQQRTEYPPEYWELLSQYQRAISLSVADSSGGPTQHVTRLAVQLADIESRLGVRMAQPNLSHQISEKDSFGETLPGLQRKLKSTEALLSFHCAEGESYLWAVTRDGFEFHPLQSGAGIRAGVTELRRALLQRDVSARSAGARVEQALFAPLSEQVQRKPDWILSLDGPLFDLPFAALPVHVNGKTAYLGHLHSLRTIPGGLAGSAPGSGSQGAGFAAVADPVYNTADPRWAETRRMRPSDSNWPVCRERLARR